MAALGAGGVLGATGETTGTRRPGRDCWLGAVSGGCSWSGEGPGDASEEEVVDTADDVEVACR